MWQGKDIPCFLVSLVERERWSLRRQNKPYEKMAENKSRGESSVKDGRQSIKLEKENSVKEYVRDKSSSESRHPIQWISAVRTPPATTSHSASEVPSGEYWWRSLSVSTSYLNFPGFSLCTETAAFESCCSWESTGIHRKYTLPFFTEILFSPQLLSLILKKNRVWLMNMQLFMNRRSPQTVDD